MRIIVDTQVKHKLFALVKILIDGGYYATEYAAAQYVVNIYAFIDTIPSRAMAKQKTNGTVSSMLLISPTGVLPGTLPSMWRRIFI